MYCRDVDYLDYTSSDASTSHFVLSASSNNVTVQEALSQSTEGGWSPSSQDQEQSDSVWISYALLLDENSAYDVTINAIKFNVAGAESVSARYTFLETGSEEEEFPVGESEDVVDGFVQLDVREVAVQVDQTVTAVKIVIVPSNEEPLVVSNMEVKICYSGT